jgi:propanol-preferring alcohol dehydrogenase
VDAPVPAPDEVLVEVSACGMCRTDLHVVEGDLPVRRANVIPGHQIVGRVETVGDGVNDLKVGERVGVAWLHRTCGICAFCRAGRENLCERAEFTGWTVPGGYAEYAVAHASFVYRLPEGFTDLQAAPLLCAGIIGYRALRLTGLGADGKAWAGARLGIYGFGAAGHVCIQVARARGAEVYVDAAIIFAPAGEIVPVALSALERGGVLVLGGIHMSTIPAFDYALIYGERVVRSVANNTRADGREFLREAAAIPVSTHVETFPLAAANEALAALKHDAIRGAGVLLCDSKH